MARLAEKAGVALATPYNLIGTKSDILLEIVREDLTILAGQVLTLPTDSLLTWITELSLTMAHIFYPRRLYYRRMVRTVMSEETASAQHAIHLMSHEIYEPSLKRLIRQGNINSDISANTLAIYVSHILVGVQQERVVMKGTEEGFRIAYEKGLLLLTCGVCPPRDRDRLLKRLNELEGMQSTR